MYGYIMYINLTIQGIINGNKVCSYTYQNLYILYDESYNHESWDWYKWKTSPRGQYSVIVHSYASDIQFLSRTPYRV